MISRINCVLSFVAFVAFFSQPVLARLGETPEECAKRYGDAVKTKTFDPKVADHMAAGLSKDRALDTENGLDFSGNFVPTRVSEFKPNGFNITLVYVKFVAKGRMVNYKPEWSGERAMAITIEKNDGHDLEKEAIASILLKQFDGPVGHGFPEEDRLLKYESDMNNFQAKLNALMEPATKKGWDYQVYLDSKRQLESNLKSTKEWIADFTNRKQEEQESMLKELNNTYEQLQNKDSVTFKKGGRYPLEVSFDKHAVKVAIADGNGNLANQCLSAYKVAMKTLGDKLSDLNAKSEDAKILKKSEKQLGTDAL